MKAKVAQNEALADSYGSIADESTSLDDEIDQAIDAPKSGEIPGSEELQKLKSKLFGGTKSAESIDSSTSETKDETSELEKLKKELRKND